MDVLVGSLSIVGRGQVVKDQRVAHVVEGSLDIQGHDRLRRGARDVVEGAFLELDEDVGVPPKSPEKENWENLGLKPRGKFSKRIV